MRVMPCKERLPVLSQHQTSQRQCFGVNTHAVQVEGMCVAPFHVAKNFIQEHYPREEDLDVVYPAGWAPFSVHGGGGGEKDH
jgi:hypothetical protein